MHNKQQKKSLGFLSVVAFLMILVGVVYTVSGVFATNATATTPTSPLGESPEISPTPKENLFASLEKQVATTATSLRNGVWGAPTTTSSNTGKNPSSPEPTPTSPTAVASIGLATPQPLQEVYDDISLSVYKDAILVGYSNGLWQKANSFHPSYHVRISDFIRVVMDAYRLKQWIISTDLEGLTEKMYFSFKVPDEVARKMNSAYELWFLQKLALKNADGSDRSQESIRPAEAKEILWLMEKKTPSLVKNPPALSYSSETFLCKEELAQLVVASFDIKLNERSLPVFSDISRSPYLDQIQKLSKLWLVSGVNGKFYPDAPIENKDFVVIIARTLLLKQWATQSFIDSFYYLKPLLNVSTTTAYAPYLEYCLEFEMCATLLTQTSWGVSFQPNRMLSRHEVVPIILATTQGKLEAVPRGEWSITRGELANLLIRSLESSPAGTNQPEKKAEESAGAKSRRETFQDLMKIS